MVDVLRTRDATAHGVSAEELRGPDWIRESQGLYRRAGVDASLLSACRRMLNLLPSNAGFSHWTAAEVYCLWLPKLPEWLPKIATMPPDTDRPERSGLYVARSRARLVPVEHVEGVPVVPPAFCLGQLAEDLRLVDLVAVVDSALHQRWCTVADIEAAIRPRQRGLPMLRAALKLCDGRSESPWETYLRLVYVAAGIDVEPQYVVHDERGGFLARADLRINGTRRLPEYDGADHRDRRQHESDLGREKALAREGWERFGYIAREIVSAPGRIISDAEAALGLPPDPRRTGEWLGWARESGLTWDGKRRLLHRLHRYHRPLRGRVRP